MWPMVLCAIAGQRDRRLFQVNLRPNQRRDFFAALAGEDEELNDPAVDVVAAGRLPGRNPINLRCSKDQHGNGPVPLGEGTLGRG